MAQLDEALLSFLHERLLSRLRRHADATGRVSATHQAIADSLGMTREAVSREILALKQAGRIVTHRGRIDLT